MLLYWCRFARLIWDYTMFSHNINMADTASNGSNRLITGIIPSRTLCKGCMDLCLITVAKWT